MEREATHSGAADEAIQCHSEPAQNDLGKTNPGVQSRSLPSSITQMRDSFGKGIERGFRIQFLSSGNARVNIWTGGGEIELKVNKAGSGTGQMAIGNQPVPSYEQTAKAQAFSSFKGSQAAGSIASGPAAAFADPRKPQTEATQTQKARNRKGGAVGR
jgi:hypothetical protein